MGEIKIAAAPVSWGVFEKTEGDPLQLEPEQMLDQMQAAGYAGTELGVYVSFDDGGSWAPFQFNLPATPITDIKVVGDDLALSTMGRSFWVMDNLEPLRQWGDAVMADGAYFSRMLEISLRCVRARSR